ncbi:unnamed protein product [Dimorphilus gyrociliatus]|uniref:RING-type domain-containing protein n=1 Tax=Dimorphilus gyrociliatus TaxID=2664684 RepID=A0A7I8VF92_9ANNE|nr:unnamed protein product [Dimorphilus gyrociliatus]
MANSRYYIDEKDLQCGICLEAWLDKDPRVLPCQHTFCFGCLNGTSRFNFINCPMCRLRVQIPSGDVNNFPKNLFKNAIQTHIIEKCLKHDKQVIKPKIVCLTCRSENLCGLCLDDDHSDYCSIKSFLNVQEAVKDFKDACLELVNQHNSEIDDEVKKLMDKISEKKKLWQSLIDKNERDLKTKVLKSKQKKQEVSSRILKKLENIFIDQNDIKEDIANFLSTKLTDKNSLKFVIYPEINDINTRNYKIISKCIYTTDFNFVFGYFCYTDEGLYELSHDSTDNDYEKNDELPVLCLREKNDSNPIKYTLSHRISNFVVIDSCIYGIQTNVGSLLICKKPFKKHIEFSTVYQEKQVWFINAYEDNEGNRYVLTYGNSYKTHLCYFINDEIKWEKNLVDFPMDACILSNGYVVIGTNSQFLVFNKDDGRVKAVEIRGKIAKVSLCPLHTGGFLMTDDNLPKLKQYDNLINYVKDIYIDVHPDICRTTKSGMLFLRPSTEVINARLYKLK